MAKNYRQLTDSIKGRLNPDNLLINKTFSDELNTISYSDTLVFIRTAMKGVEPEYTAKSKEAGERVKDHLDKNLSGKTFEYQGSVMTNTHIKGASDIDLLVISDKFYSYDIHRINSILQNSAIKEKYFQSSIKKLENEKSISAYSGDSLIDLKSLRLGSEETLIPIYKICDVSKPKAIKIKNLSLNREVDVVIANWYDDVSSIINDKGDYRGVQVYNKDTHSKGVADYPFLSIKKINEKSKLTNGRLKKMIRFLKNIKSLSDLDIKLSSFDINAICYDIDTSKYQHLVFHELVGIIYTQLKSLSTNKTHANDLVSVDGREYIFRNDPDKLSNLENLIIEIESVKSDLRNIVIYG